MEDKNKTYSDGWDPTEYEIYTKEETEKESAEIPLNTEEDEVLPKKRKSKKIWVERIDRGKEKKLYYIIFGAV